jgi:COMPASS component SWD3
VRVHDESKKHQSHTPRLHLNPLPKKNSYIVHAQNEQVRIYDEATKTLQSTLSGGYGRSKAGHSNRVFSLKYSSTDENIILSGGWDNTIQIWDVRQDVPVRSVFGPHITGDAVDLHGNEILSGSWRPDKQLQVRFSVQAIGV